MINIFTRATLLHWQSTKHASKPLQSVVARTLHKVDLESVFSDNNKIHVQSKLDTARPLIRPLANPKGPKSEAAVLVPMCYIGQEPSILFMMRSRDLNSHSGEICFPGGMKDSTDRDLVHTALRETHEEIGLSEEHVDVWGRLPPSRARAGSQVTPVLGFCGNYEDKPWKINDKEVQEIFTRSIASLCDSDNIRTTQFRYENTGYTMPVFFGSSAKHRVWGLTAVILHQVLSTIAPGIYNFKVKHKR
ncbi:mitochondrial coenzyme A diphosphatase NUDT8-like [Dreissena polymorpha]|uniref:Nudix hydrolase domain-containing protein n=1 Tax=Dreissena polymorpha TaxID=45954 RepID=A0A9D4DUW9_DREPO|nr:mitochondrial coenzyme A diphosphatase NUDT8-like [Dreissena polymorpha]KAH3755206.1 hypothetical protein DPMN_189896 [Dreissena polymorpha]